MSDETTPVEEQNAETPAPETASAPVETPAAAAPAPEAPVVEEQEVRKDVEMIMCMVSKQMVPLDETIELERKKGEVLRIHERYKKFES